jgi:hypothetical protein
MRRVMSALLSACVLVSLSILTGPAKAGDYYDDGYSRPRHSYNTWSNSDCCYKKVVRVHYRRLENEGYYDRSYRQSNYDRPSYRQSYYDRPSYRQSYYDRPSYRQSYYDRPYRSSYTYDSPRRYGYDSYVSSGYSGYSSYADNCYKRSVPIGDDRGGWVWGTKSRCY